MPQYASAKAAEIYLASALARELGPRGVRVNSISPGAIMFPGGDWEERRAVDPEAFDRWRDASFPLGRLGTPDEVADVVSFVLSARASWISGTDILVSGAQNRLLPDGYWAAAVHHRPGEPHERVVTNSVLSSVRLFLCRGRDRTGRAAGVGITYGPSSPRSCSSRL